jgi:hypothetical protein
MDPLPSADAIPTSRDLPTDVLVMMFPPPAQGCLPPVLHPVSAHILELFVQGWLPVEEFMRLFSLPNSDYIPITECILRSMAS